MGMEWFAPVLAVVLVTIGLILLLLGLGIFLYAVYQDIKDKVARDRAKLAQGQTEAG